MTLQILNPDNYTLTLHAAFSIYVGIAVAALGVYVLIKEHGSPVGPIFWIFTLCISIWLTGFGAVSASPQQPQALWWTQFALMGVVFIPATILLLASAVTQRLHQYRGMIWVGMAISAFFSFSVIFTNLYIKGFYQYSWGYFPKYGPLGIAFVVYFAGILISVLRIYWIEYRHAANDRRKKRFRGLLIAYSIAYLASSDFLATLGVPVYPFGYIPIIPFLFITAHVITRYRLVDITPELAASQILETMQGAVIVTDMESKIRVINRAALEMLGTQKPDLLGRDLRSVIDIPAVTGSYPDAKGSVVSAETIWSGGSGRRFDVSVSSSILTDTSDNSPLGTIYVAHDITKRKQVERQLEKLALYDSLTGLPNRTLFYDRVNLLLALAKRNQYILAVLYMDLDRFKTVNDTLGHEVGDLILTQAAERMMSCTRRSDTVARMGGDEFIGICGRIAASADAAVVAGKIITVLSEPFRIKGHECTIGASIGISLYPLDGDDVETLISKADTALYRVKEAGGGGFRFFSDYILS